MNDRKQYVINKAHQLFIKKGFQATLIQDIIDVSGISKGTFYNYFSSKNELLIALFTSLNQKINQEQDDLLLGQDPADIEIFIKQLELHMTFNRRNKLLTLFEEVFISNDPVLKQFLKRTQIKHLHWIHHRLVDIFAESTRPYLLDCAIMFIGMLHQNIRFHFLANESVGNINQVIRYTVERLEKMVYEVERNGVQLLDSEILQKWLPECNKSGHSLAGKLNNSIVGLKKSIKEGENQLRDIELLDFIQDEILHSKRPRKFLIKSALASLKEDLDVLLERELQVLEEIVDDFVGSGTP